MIIEHQELRDKINKLEKFLSSEGFNSLNYKMQTLLDMQHRIMIEYSLIIKERISNM